MGGEGVRLAGRRLAGRYELEDEIASGGMGAVWRARDDVLGRPVAVKILHDRLTRDPDLLDRFRREAIAAARLSHPAVVRVFDTGIDDGVCYIVMELFEGRTLESVLAERGHLEPDEAGRIVGGVLPGLGHAHQQGVVHRDVKPGNILIDPGGLVKVADFGIAKAAFAGEDLTTTGNLLGTSRYLAPEQITGGPVDARADLYATGIVLYEALTGRTPFQGETHIATATMRLTKDPVPPRALRSGIPRELDRVVMRALVRDPDDRYRSAQEMHEALRRAVPASGHAMLSSVAPRAEPGPAPSPVRSWLAVPVLVLLVASLAVGGFWVLGQVLEDGQGEGGNEGGGEIGQETLRSGAVRTYDPPPGDGEEHDEGLSAATDGNPSTYWTTERYTTPDLGGRKEGVGIVTGLDAPAEIGTMQLLTDTPGFEFGVYLSDTPDAFDLGSPVASGVAEEEITNVELGGVQGQYVLLWITNLVPFDGYRAHVNEIELLSP